MRHRLNSIIDPFLTPSRARWVFILGIILFAMLGNAIYDLAFATLGSPLTILGITLLAFVVVPLINALLKRLGRRSLVTLGVQQRRGLVVPVSIGVLQGGATQAAIEYHYRGKDDNERPTGTLQYCWLLTSPDTPRKDPDKPVPLPPEGQASAWANAVYLRDKYTGLINIQIVQIDPNDPKNIFEKVEGILQEARRRGLGQNEVAVNFKPGTKETSVGMVLAATTLGYSVETTLPSQRDADGYRLAGSTSELVTFDLRPILHVEAE